MSFTDLRFLFLLFPIFMVLYYLLSPRWKQVILILFSLLIYACGSPAFVFYLCISMAVNVAAAKLVDKTKKEGRITVSRILLTAGILFDLSALCYYKYINFFLSSGNRVFGTAFATLSILMPLGLSFYTFKAISFLADAYLGKIEKVSVLQGVNYLSFFAQMQSGPIARYSDFSAYQKFSAAGVSDGVVRFMIGFSKKVILADVLCNVVIEIFDNTSVYSTSLAWLGALCYTLQLYYDFSGYSDMAIGIGKMLGYPCPENFNYPYMTKSVAEFWRRWHISLGSWFRDYVYIPLGGSRVGRFRLYLNLLAVWFLTGLWHGAGWNFIFWGLGYFVLISFEKTVGLPDRLPNAVCRFLYRIFTLLIINFQWVIFRCSSLRDGLHFIKVMCTGVSSYVPSTRAAFLFRDYGVFIGLAALFAFPVVNLIEKQCKKNRVSSAVFDIVYVIGVVTAFVIALSFIISGQNSPFLYGNF